MDERIYPPETVKGELDYTSAGRRLIEIVVTWSGDPTIRDDRGRHGIRHRPIEAAAVLGHAGIVHDDGAAACRNESGIRGAKAPPCPGDDSDLAVEANRRHG